MAFVKVTGYLEVEDDQLDPGPQGPITNEAYEVFTGISPSEMAPTIDLLEDLTFEADDR